METAHFAYVTTTRPFANVLSHFGYKFIPCLTRYFNICRNLFPNVSVFRTFFVTLGSSLRGKPESGGSPLLSFTPSGFLPPFPHFSTFSDDILFFSLLTYWIFSYLEGEKLCIVNQRKQFVNLRFEVL